ncbi:hypothetical protein NEDG_01058 [Nematocida displodere]|uniref:Uncharacterized protein n=1 Tax=Nematocida displodere TaxID=1805483 RepID=A0A177ED45_9MICR|nr:hypothetical protein NEDG_01058 [Nematocida displodere]
MEALSLKLSALKESLQECRDKTEKTKTALEQTLKEVKKLSAETGEKPGPITRAVENELSKSILLQFTLGVDELKLPDRNKFKYKSNYETFKITSTVMVTILTACNLLFIDSKILDTIQVLAHMYIYSTLTIREHILINNGSNIKGWWLLHHYVCIVLTGMMLTCPEVSFKQIRTPILKFMFLHSCSQVFQYQYQMRRLYVLRALKKAHPLETTSDILSVSLSANLGIVVFFLIFFQVIQMYVSYYIYHLHCLNKWNHYQPFIGSILIGALAVGNVSTILYTCIRKLEKKRR